MQTINHHQSRTMLRTKQVAAGVLPRAAFAGEPGLETMRPVYVRSVLVELGERHPEEPGNLLELARRGYLPTTFGQTVIDVVESDRTLVAARAAFNRKLSPTGKLARRVLRRMTGGRS